MSAAAAELAELRKRVDTLEVILRALGVPLNQLGPMVAEDHAKLTALSTALTTAFSYAGAPVPEGLRSKPRSHSHLHLVRGGAS